MIQRICSLKTGGTQSIPSRTWTAVRFPFDDGSEPFDPDNMHTHTPQIGGTVTSDDPESGLIWPLNDAWATMQGFMIWEPQKDVASASRFTLTRHRFSRDPFDANDTTATTCVPASSDHAVSTSSVLSWNFWVHPNVPIGYLVWHNAPVPRTLTLGEFKLSYWVDLSQGLLSTLGALRRPVIHETGTGRVI